MAFRDGQISREAFIKSTKLSFGHSGDPTVNDYAHGTPKTLETGQLYVDTASGVTAQVLKVWDATNATWRTMAATGGWTGSMQNAYALGTKILKSGTVVEIEEDGNNGALLLDKDGSGAGTVLEIDNDGTGDSLLISASGSEVFSIDSTGVPTVTIGQFFPDDIPIRLGNTIAASDILIEWDTAATPDALLFTAAVANTPFIIGDATYTMDIRFFGAGSTGVWDASANTLTLNGGDIYLLDSDILAFGDAQDVLITWDATNLTIKPATDDTGAIVIGDGTTDMDLKWTGGASTDFVNFDMSIKTAVFDDVDIKVTDDTVIWIGTATNNATADGDISIKWDATNLLIEAAAAQDTGQIRLGSTNAIDLAVYANTNTKIALFDSSAAELLLTTYDLRLADTSVLYFGNSKDISITWDATDLIVDAVAENMVIKVGYTNGIDFQLYGDTNTAYVLFDASTPVLDFVGTTPKLADATALCFGTSTGLSVATGDVSMQWDGTNFLIEALTQDTGIIKLGATNSMDFAIYGNTATKIITFDSGAAELITTDYDITIVDSDILNFGTGKDVTFSFNATDLLIEAAVQDTGSIKIGSTNALDFFVYGADAAKYVQVDTSVPSMKLVNVPLYVGTTATRLLGGTETITFHALAATDAVDRVVWIAPWACILVSVSVRFATASTSGTLMVEKCADTEAVGSGTDCLSGTISLAGTAATATAGALHATAANYTLAATNALGLDFGGTMTSLADMVVTIEVARTA